VTAEIHRGCASGKCRNGKLLCLKQGYCSKIVSAKIRLDAWESWRWARFVLRGALGWGYGFQDPPFYLF
jgi:hypothetical protein